MEERGRRGINFHIYVCVMCIVDAFFAPIHLRSCYIVACKYIIEEKMDHDTRRLVCHHQPIQSHTEQRIIIFYLNKEWVANVYKHKFG